MLIKTYTTGNAATTFLSKRSCCDHQASDFVPRSKWLSCQRFTLTYPLRDERQPQAFQLTRRVVEGERMLFGLGDDKVELDLLSEQQVREREGVQR